MAWRVPRAKVKHKVEPVKMPEHKKLYNLRRWKRVRERHLQENPFCVHCLNEGRHELGTEVDHITPHRGNEYLFWMRSNHQTLCRHHHGVKSASERNGGNDDV